MIQRIKLLLIYAVCLLAGVISAGWMFFAIMANSPRARAIALGFDQLGNATFGGSEDETVSSRCWRYRKDPNYARAVRLINWLANDPNHCRDSFEAERLRVPRSDRRFNNVNTGSEK